MGEWKGSVNYHYSRGNLVALYRIAEDAAVDEDDRELARKLAKELERDNSDIEEKER